MNDDEVWTAVDTQRLRTVELLEDLSDADWRQPSLCADWSVRDVAAHLTMQQMTIGDALGSIIKHPGQLGGMNRMIRRMAQDRAARPTDQLISDIRATVGTHRPNVGVTNRETLIDILVHGQDIAIPLGRELPMPTDAAAIAAATVWGYGGKGKAKVFATIPLQRCQLTATDTAWSVGDGPTLQGPIAAILLLLTGREVGLSQLVGPGAVQLRHQLAHS